MLQTSNMIKIRTLIDIKCFNVAKVSNGEIAYFDMKFQSL